MLKLLKPITAINGFRIGDKVRLKDGDGRPHIIKAVVIGGLKEFFFVVQFEDGTETMLDNISPLPSNLDEAAWKYGLDNQSGFCSQSVKVDSFKAGAEWMTKQGETVEGEVVSTSTDGWECVRLYKKLHSVDDKVIVQIRKK